MPYRVDCNFLSFWGFAEEALLLLFKILHFVQNDNTERAKLKFINFIVPTIAEQMFLWYTE